MRALLVAVVVLMVGPAQARHITMECPRGLNGTCWKPADATLMCPDGKAFAPPAGQSVADWNAWCADQAKAEGR
jgi:hypothetical protein